MKELSIEEKAKRYDESIERAKEIQAAYKELFGDEYSGEDIFEIFPELAEREEEKLSEKLHQCVCRAINNDKLPYEERKYISEKVIPYLENLEKQKEAKTTWSEEDCLQLDAAIHLVNSTGHVETMNWLKSFKDRMAWRPTEEQMESIARATNRCISVGDAKVLLKLYEDLKKL